MLSGLFFGVEKLVKVLPSRLSVEAEFLLRDGESSHANFDIRAARKDSLATRNNGRTRRKHIIDQQNTPARKLFGIAHLEDALDILPTLVALVASLTLVVDFADEGVVVDLCAQDRGYAVGDVVRLVVSAL